MAAGLLTFWDRFYGMCLTFPYLYEMILSMGRETYWDWRTQGPCSTLNPRTYDKLFFPESGRSINEAKAFCLGCPVKDMCLEFALSTGADGIWAGTNKKEREGILKFRAQLRGEVLVPKVKAAKKVAITFT